MKKIDFKIKSIPEDFVVNEVPLLPPFLPRKVSHYTYLWLKKRGLTTFEALEEIASFFQVPLSEVNAEGLKDEDAITFQIVSLKKLLKQKGIADFNKKYSDDEKMLHIEYLVGFGEEPVREKLLHGNSFKIVIRNLQEETANRLGDLILKNRIISLINYYDSQRFGLPGGPYNTHLIGKAIVEGNWKQAYLEYQRSGNAGANPQSVTTPADDTFCLEFFKKANPKKVSFFVSSYNSHLWNKAASESATKRNTGEKYHFSGVGELFVPRGSDLVSESVCSAEGYRLDLENFEAGPKINTRSLLITTNIYLSKIEEDDLNAGRWKIEVAFFLPTGCYATMLIRQLFLRYLLLTN